MSEWIENPWQMVAALSILANAALGWRVYRMSRDDWALHNKLL